MKFISALSAVAMAAAGSAAMAQPGNAVRNPVDDVSVTQHIMSAVPQPKTYAMLLSGLLLVGLSIRRGP